MPLIQGRELWVFVFWVLFLDITKIFRPLGFKIKNGAHYLYLNHMLQQMKILPVWFQFYIRHLKERERKNREGGWGKEKSEMGKKGEIADREIGRNIKDTARA